MRKILVLMVLLMTGIPPLETSQAEDSTAVAIFAGGCFWCLEAELDGLEGIVSATSGYIGGSVKNPTYEDVSSGRTGHVEAVQVVFSPAKLSYEKLLGIFWRNIDPTDSGGQFYDRGSQYRTVIFYTSEEQKLQAEASKQQTEGKLGKPVATEIKAASQFYPAEEYHQDYHNKNPLRYQAYKSGSGRTGKLRRLWGEE